MAKIEHKHAQVLVVPAFVGRLVFGDNIEKLEACGRQLGRRTEIDVDQVRRILGGGAADALAAYWDECRLFWARASHGHRLGPFIGTRRTLIDVTQTTGKTGRADLGCEYDALLSIPAFTGILGELLAAQVDLTRLTRLTEGFCGIVGHNGVNQTTLELSSTAGSWPDALGGPSSIGEVRRSITLVARHATWRDRKVRRLASVNVSALELWPDPATVPAVTTWWGQK